MTHTRRKYLAIVCKYESSVPKKAPTHQHKASFSDKRLCQHIKQRDEFNLFLEMYHYDQERFRHYLHMSPSKFDFLLSKVDICLNSVVLQFLPSAVV